MHYYIRNICSHELFLTLPAINKSVMKVIVDNKIPFIKEAIEKIADEVVYAPGKDFTPSLVKGCGCTHHPTRTLEPKIIGGQ